MDEIAANLRFPQLGKRQQRGSKPRCHLLTSGAREDIAGRLTSLIEPWGQVLAEDSWMPNGFLDPEEAQLHKAEKIITGSQDREELLNWWLAFPTPNTATPNWDIASTCCIRSKPGLLLIEAKAHCSELRREESGKALGRRDNKPVSFDSRRNHMRIGCSIQEAGSALSEQTNLKWALSRDCCYQMSNRFAWAWKLTQLGKPVVLVYLGFLDCGEMQDGPDKTLIASQPAWQQMIEDHSRQLFPYEVWNREWHLHGQSFIPLVRTYNQPLAHAISADA
jgi:hypothetical protein